MEYSHEMQAENYIELGQRLREATPSAPPPSPTPGSYPIAHATRLHSINQMISELEKEKTEREALVKRYKKFMSAAHVVDHSCTTLAVGATAAGLAVLTTIVGTPIAVAIQSTGLAFGCGTLLAKYVFRKTSVKNKKHAKIVELCQSTLQDIRAETSKALSNGHVSDEQYRLCLDLHRKYEQMKKRVQTRAEAKISDLEQQNAWMEQGRKDAIKEIEKSLFKRTFSRRSQISVSTSTST